MSSFEPFNPLKLFGGLPWRRFSPSWRSLLVLFALGVGLYTGGIALTAAAARLTIWTGIVLPPIIIVLADLVLLLLILAVVLAIGAGEERPQPKVLEPIPLFERRDTVMAVIARIGSHAHLRLLGASGVGKSVLLTNEVIPELRSTPTWIPVYVEHLGNEWGVSEFKVVANAIRLELGYSAESTAIADDHLGDLIGLLEAETTRRPVLIIDQFDDYYITHLGRLRQVVGGIQHQLTAQELVDTNPFWRALRDAVSPSAVHCVIACRTDMSFALETVRFTDEIEACVLAPLTRTDVSRALVGHARVNKVANADHGWYPLVEAVCTELSDANGVILPVQMKIVLEQLEQLEPATMWAYVAKGRRQGLEASYLEDAIGKAVAASGVPATEVYRLLGTLIGTSGELRHLPPGELSNALTRATIDRLPELLRSLAASKVIQRIASESPGQDGQHETWKLAHEYLVAGLDRLQLSMQTLAQQLNNADAVFHSAPGSKKLRALLGPRLLWAAVRHHYVNERPPAPWRRVVLISGVVTAGLSAVIVFTLFSAVRWFSEQWQTDDFISRFDANPALHRGEATALTGIEGASLSLRRRIFDTLLGSSSGSSSFTAHADYLFDALAGRDGPSALASLVAAHCDAETLQRPTAEACATAINYGRGTIPASPAFVRASLGAGIEPYLIRLALARGLRPDDAGEVIRFVVAEFERSPPERAGQLVDILLVAGRTANVDEQRILGEVALKAIVDAREVGQRLRVSALLLGAVVSPSLAWMAREARQLLVNRIVTSSSLESLGDNVVLLRLLPSPAPGSVEGDELAAHIVNAIVTEPRALARQQLARAMIFLGDTIDPNLRRRVAATIVRDISFQDVAQAAVVMGLMSDLQIRDQRVWEPVEEAVISSMAADWQSVELIAAAIPHLAADSRERLLSHVSLRLESPETGFSYFNAALRVLPSIEGRISGSAARHAVARLFEQRQWGDGWWSPHWLIAIRRLDPGDVPVVCEQLRDAVLQDPAATYSAALISAIRDLAPRGCGAFDDAFLRERLDLLNELLEQAAREEIRGAEGNLYPIRSRIARLALSIASDSADLPKAARDDFFNILHRSLFLDDTALLQAMAEYVRVVPEEALPSIWQGLVEAWTNSDARIAARAQSMLTILAARVSDQNALRYLDEVLRLQRGLPGECLLTAALVRNLETAQAAEVAMTWYTCSTADRFELGTKLQGIQPDTQTALPRASQ